MVVGGIGGPTGGRCRSSWGKGVEAQTWAGAGVWDQEARIR